MDVKKTGTTVLFLLGILTAVSYGALKFTADLTWFVVLAVMLVVDVAFAVGFVAFLKIKKIPVFKKAEEHKPIEEKIDFE